MTFAMLTEKYVEESLPQEEASFIRAYVQYARNRNCAPIAYHVGTALAVLASTCPQDFGGWYVDTTRPNLFTMLVGRSGEDYKSTAANLGRGLLYEADPKRTIQAAETAEKLAENLCVTPVGMITYQELGEFLKVAKTGGYGERLKMTYNSLWECAPGAGSHVVRKASFVPDNPRVSIAAACSLPYLEEHTEESDWTGGFMGRWAVLYARSERINSYPIFDDSVRPLLVGNLATRCAITTAGFCTGFTDDAFQVWDAWYKSLYARPFPKIVAGTRARVPTIAFKAALIYAWDFLEEAREPGTWKMPMKCLVPGIQFAEMHIKSLLHLDSMIADSPDARLRRRVLMMFEDAPDGCLTLAQIYGNLKLAPRKINEVLQGLSTERKIIMTTERGEAAYKRWPEGLAA